MTAPTFTAEQFAHLLEAVRQGAAARQIAETAAAPPAAPQAPQRPLSELSQAELSHALTESLRAAYKPQSPGWLRPPSFFD